MKKQKQTYSMTAKERKAIRRGETQTENTDERNPDSESMQVDREGAAVVRKKNFGLMITGIVLALVIILTAVLLLVLLPGRSKSKYPRAIITLSDGTVRRTVTMTIWEDECPIAASNFIFLSRIGFFNGTIVYDVQPGRNYMRFGAYKGYSTGETRYEDDAFIASIPTKVFNIVNLESNSYFTSAQSKKFGYRLRKDASGDAKRYGDPYVVSMNTNNAADFVINLEEGNTNFTNQNGQSNIASRLTAFGQIEDEASRKVIDWLYGLEKNENPGLNNVVGTSPVVTIENVKIENLDKNKWDDFEFVTYMNKAYNGSSAWSGWVG